MRPLLLLPILALSFASAFAQADDAGQAAASARRFINAYIKATPAGGAESGLKWINKSPLVTDGYKQSLAKLYSAASRKDPELGYGSDAVLGGQDFPDHFEIKSSRADGGKATVILSGPKAFPMEVKVLLLKSADKWLVDASGDLVH